MSGMEAACLKHFMLGLERAERCVLLLHYADELSIAEIALVMDLPRSRVERMLDRLVRGANEALARGRELSGSAAGPTGTASTASGPVRALRMTG